MEKKINNVPSPVFKPSTKNKTALQKSNLVFIESVPCSCVQKIFSTKIISGKFKKTFSSLTGNQNRGEVGLITGFGMLQHIGSGTKDEEISERTVAKQGNER